METKLLFNLLMETTQTQHTPGPWQLTTVPFELRSTDDAASIYGPQSRDGGACLIACVSRSAGDNEATANAQLIASAPELLQALKAFVESNSFHDDLFINARAAIAKAEGK